MSADKVFLFLQGPHGPFFHQLGLKLALTGAKVQRIGFTLGDRIFWHSSLRFTSFSDVQKNWHEYLNIYLEKEGVTDIVLYGDSRPLHQSARDLAAEKGITVHCFEEGYLRPYWATYERGGTNGNSKLMGLSVTDMRKAVEQNPIDLPEIPVQWGAIWHHALYGFLYHFFIAIPSIKYRFYRSHRAETVFKELLLYIRRLIIMPFQGVMRRSRTRALLQSGSIYHLVLLQLSHDASLRSHSRFDSVEEFIKLCISEFAKAAPKHHFMALKAHPFEDGREPIPAIIRKYARQYQVTNRVIFIPGGKLGPLLDGAKSAVTINSTASQQALWRGLPVRAFGKSVFSKPEFVSAQTLGEFFQHAEKPSTEAYKYYRQFLLETSQIAGSFYTRNGRALLLRQLVDQMLEAEDQYSKILATNISTSAKVVKLHNI